MSGWPDIFDTKDSLSNCDMSKVLVNLARAVNEKLDNIAVTQNNTLPGPYVDYGVYSGYSAFAPISPNMRLVDEVKIAGLIHERVHALANTSEGYWWYDQFLSNRGYLNHTLIPESGNFDLQPVNQYLDIYGNAHGSPLALITPTFPLWNDTAMKAALGIEEYQPNPRNLNCITKGWAWEMYSMLNLFKVLRVPDVTGVPAWPMYKREQIGDFCYGNSVAQCDATLSGTAGAWRYMPYDMIMINKNFSYTKQVSTLTMSFELPAGIKADFSAYMAVSANTLPRFIPNTVAQKWNMIFTSNQTNKLTEQWLYPLNVFFGDTEQDYYYRGVFFYHHRTPVFLFDFSCEGGFEYRGKDW